MKIQVRKGCFETNSSSVHSLCIPVAEDYRPLPKAIVFEPKEYGWGAFIETNPGNYLYSMLLTMGMYKYIDVLKELLEQAGIKVKFKKPRRKPEFVDDEGIKYYDYVDHGNCFVDWDIRYLFYDKEKLFRFLFAPDSCIYIYSDGSNWDTYIDEIRMLEASGRFEIHKKCN